MDIKKLTEDEITEAHVARLFGRAWRKIPAFFRLHRALELIAAFDHNPDWKSELSPNGCGGNAPVHECPCRQPWEYETEIAAVALASLSDKFKEIA